MTTKKPSTREGRGNKGYFMRKRRLIEGKRLKTNGKTMCPHCYGSGVNFKNVAFPFLPGSSLPCVFTPCFFCKGDMVVSHEKANTYADWCCKERERGRKILFIIFLFLIIVVFVIAYYTRSALIMSHAP